MKGVSSETVRYYKGVGHAFSMILKSPTKQGTLEAVQMLLKRGVSPIGVNTYLRGFQLIPNGCIKTPCNAT